MLTNKPVANVSKYLKLTICSVFLLSVALSAGCRYDMQDQPRYKAYEESKFYNDGRSMRDAPDGTMARGKLQENKALFTGKKDDADPNVQVETTTDENGNTIVSSFPNDVEEMPIPLTKELLDRGEERYRVFCIVCHGPVGKGDGMVVRRGYPKPSTYHDDRLRNAPVGHFFDVISNGWGKMNGYSSQIPVTDRWAIVAYIRALQASQNPEPKNTENAATAETENGTQAVETQETQPQQPVNKDGGEE
jgi:mono/diheme cytochrome c family protein